MSEATIHGPARVRGEPLTAEELRAMASSADVADLI